MTKQKIFRVKTSHPEFSGYVLNFIEIKTEDNKTLWVGKQESTGIEYEVEASYCEMID